MKDENERININLERMFPEAARRVHVLEELKRSWPSVVGIPASRHSIPCVLGVNTITVSVDSDEAANSLRKSRGNIMKALSSQFGCMTDNNFVLVIKIGNHRNKYESQNGNRNFRS